ncbi:hypothetical protein [Arthrobacter sp. Ld5]
MARRHTPEQVIAKVRLYNHERPHGSLDGMTPSTYWKRWTAENQLAIA